MHSVCFQWREKGALKDKNMHKEQCIGPVLGAFQCVSMAASINRSTTVSKGGGWTLLRLGAAKCKPEFVAPSRGRTVVVCLLRRRKRFELIQMC